MNAGIFGAYLTPVWKNNTPTSISDAADKLASAYHLSNVGHSTTPYAAPLLNGDKDVLKTFIELGMSINFYGGQIQSTTSTIISIIKGVIGGTNERISLAEKLVMKQLTKLISTLPAPISFIGGILSSTVKSIFDELKVDSNNKSQLLKLVKKLEGILKLADTTKIGYLTMATGFCLYWLTARISPVPPMPPCISPTFGTQIIFPGLPVPLNTDLHNTFKSPQRSDEAIAKLFNSLILHQFTVAGIYGGVIPFFPSPIPGPPIPWFSILNIPFPTIKLPSLLDSDGDGKKDTRQSGSASTGNNSNQSTNSNQLGSSSTIGGVGMGGIMNSGGNVSGPQSSGTNQGSINSGMVSGVTNQSNSTGHISSNNTRATFGKMPGNTNFNPPSSISSVLFDETNSILNSMNPYGFKLNDGLSGEEYAKLIVEIRENVVTLNTGEDEYQYSVTVKLTNSAQDKRLNGAQLNLPTVMSYQRLYTFRDTVESDSSIYSTMILSAKNRAIEMIKTVFRSSFSFIIGAGLTPYIDKWYGGSLPSQLKTFGVYITTTTEDPLDKSGNLLFVPVSKFQTLQ